jgi:1-acyl-sn-glycerol-3-phosphate acyltransferase
MNDETYQLKYPRRAFTRQSLKVIGRSLLNLLADVEIVHPERLPHSGPIIMAGNHVDTLEALMMAVCTPGNVEFLGNGDIPFDPNYAFIVNAYGFIPVNRGNLDRNSLHKALDVLKQGGILGIFPEGGIWDPAHMNAQLGVAWLSHQAQCPILPIGFRGVENGIKNALRLKRPKMTMDVGEVMPPVSIQDPERSLKENLTQSATEILDAINTLLPERTLKQVYQKVEETYKLEVEIHIAQMPVKIPESLSVQHGSAYAHFLYNPIMMDALNRNLHLPIKPLKNIYRQTQLTPVLTAWQSILNYLEENPGYFTYRFGIEEGLDVEQALEELIQISAWVEQSGYALSINPIHRYRNAKTNALVIERGGCYPQSM